MPHDHITFGLALVGFALLAGDAARRWVGLRSALLTWASTLVISIHVVFVWAFRFDWSIERMWHKSAFAFLLFHGAFLLIIAGAILGERWRSHLVLFAFAIVCAGALPAPFRYDELAMLRIPVPAAFVTALAWVLSRRQRS